MTQPNDMPAPQEPADSPERAPLRPVALGSYGADVQRREDGSMLLVAPEPLGDYPRRVTDRLVHWAAECPERTFLAERDGDGWRRLRYGEALERVRALGQALLERGLSPERPLVILSGNSLEHALLSLAAQHVGIPCAPVSPAYALVSTDYAKLRHAFELLTPGLVFAADADQYGPAIEAVVPADTEVVLGRGSLSGRAGTSLDSLMATAPTAAVETAHEAVEPETIAKFMFTSGSTKLPKAVITTHRMLCCNQQMRVQCYPFLAEEPPVMVDWLPWHHTAGGNAISGLVLYHGGTLYIDDGKPTAELMHRTIRNLREIAPTVYHTVPRGLEELTLAMQEDPQLRRSFFSRLQMLYPAGAALSAPLREAIQALAVRETGQRLPMAMGLGMTETAPLALSAHLPEWQAGLIGVPAPGVEVKLVPMAGKLEVRYRGPNVTPGYWRQPELTEEAFDAEGYFRSGDAATFIDEAAPEQGLRFDGRIAEDFKLASGTWVSVGRLRARVIAAGAPYLQDAVVTGHDGNAVGLLLFLHTAAARQLAPELPTDAPLEDVARAPQVRTYCQRLLERLAAESSGSSNRVARAMILEQPPSLAAGEITDKGSINQRAVLTARADLVEELYAEPISPRVLSPAP